MVTVHRGVLYTVHSLRVLDESEKARAVIAPSDWA